MSLVPIRLVEIDDIAVRSLHRESIQRIQQTLEKTLSTASRRRLKERIEKLADKRQSGALVLSDRIKPEERTALLHAAKTARPAKALSSHQADEIAADLHQKAPWMAAAGTLVMREMRVRTSSGPAAFHAPPMIIEGRPGLGKSWWARAMAQLVGVQAITLDVGGSGGAVFSLCGSERIWGKSEAGVLVSGMISHRTTNPVMIIDEVDKAPTNVETAGGKTVPGLVPVLMSMIEPLTAARWHCPYYQVPFDLRGVSWIMTTNDASRLPQPLLDRCHLVKVPDPTAQQLTMVARSIAIKRFGEGVHADAVIGTVEAALERRQILSLRSIQRLIERAEAFLATPPLH